MTDLDRRRRSSRRSPSSARGARSRGKLRERLAGIADAVSLTNNRAPDPEHWADVVADLKRQPE